MTQTATYGFNNYSKDTARAIADAFEVIAHTHGILTPHVVVDAARHEDSVLHPLFDWNDTTAAEKFRVEQARRFIRTIRVVYTGEDGTQTQSARVYLSVDDVDDNAHAYVPMTRVLSDAGLYEQARQQFIKEARSFEMRYQQFETLALLVRGVREQAEALAS